jgi:hypothetical protein
MSVVSATGGVGASSLLGGLTADAVTDPNALERRIVALKAELSGAPSAVGSAAARARRAREVAAIRAVLVDYCSAWATHLTAVGRYEAAVRWSGVRPRGGARCSVAEGCVAGWVVRS